jgi:hypothetical protein
MIPTALMMFEICTTIKRVESYVDVKMLADAHCQGTRMKNKQHQIQSLKMTVQDLIFTFSAAAQPFYHLFSSSLSHLS